MTDVRSLNIPSDFNKLSTFTEERFEATLSAHTLPSAFNIFLRSFGELFNSEFSKKLPGNFAPNEKLSADSNSVVDLGHALVGDVAATMYDFLPLLAQQINMPPGPPAYPSIEFGRILFVEFPGKKTRLATDNSFHNIEIGLFLIVKTNLNSEQVLNSLPNYGAGELEPRVSYIELGRYTIMAPPSVSLLVRGKKTNSITDLFISEVNKICKNKFNNFNIKSAIDSPVSFALNFRKTGISLNITYPMEAAQLRTTTGVARVLKIGQLALNQIEIEFESLSLLADHGDNSVLPSSLLDSTVLPSSDHILANVMAQSRGTHQVKSLKDFMYLVEVLIEDGSIQLDLSNVISSIRKNGWLKAMDGRPLSSDYFNKYLNFDKNEVTLKRPYIEEVQVRRQNRDCRLAQSIADTIHLQENATGATDVFTVTVSGDRTLYGNFSPNQPATDLAHEYSDDSDQSDSSISSGISEESTKQISDSSDSGPSDSIPDLESSSGRTSRASHCECMWDDEGVCNADCACCSQGCENKKLGCGQKCAFGRNCVCHLKHDKQTKQTDTESDSGVVSDNFDINITGDKNSPGNFGSDNEFMGSKWKIGSSRPVTDLMMDSDGEIECNCVMSMEMDYCDPNCPCEVPDCCIILEDHEVIDVVMELEMQFELPECICNNQQVANAIADPLCVRCAFNRQEMVYAVPAEEAQVPPGEEAVNEVNYQEDAEVENLAERSDDLPAFRPPSFIDPDEAIATLRRQRARQLEREHGSRSAHLATPVTVGAPSAPAFTPATQPDRSLTGSSKFKMAGIAALKKAKTQAKPVSVLGSQAISQTKNRLSIIQPVTSSTALDFNSSELYLSGNVEVAERVAAPLAGLAPAPPTSQLPAAQLSLARAPSPAPQPAPASALSPTRSHSSSPASPARLSPVSGRAEVEARDIYMPPPDDHQQHDGRLGARPRVPREQSSTPRQRLMMNVQSVLSRRDRPGSASLAPAAFHRDAAAARQQDTDIRQASAQSDSFIRELQDKLVLADRENAELLSKQKTFETALKTKDIQITAFQNAALQNQTDSHEETLRVLQQSNQTRENTLKKYKDHVEKLTVHNGKLASENAKLKADLNSATLPASSHRTELLELHNIAIQISSKLGISTTNKTDSVLLNEISIAVSTIEKDCIDFDGCLNSLKKHRMTNEIFHPATVARSKDNISQAAVLSKIVTEVEKHAKQIEEKDVVTDEAIDTLKEQADGYRIKACGHEEDLRVLTQKYSDLHEVVKQQTELIAKNALSDKTIASQKTEITNLQLANKGLVQDQVVASELEQIKILDLQSQLETKTSELAQLESDLMANRNYSDASRITEIEKLNAELANTKKATSAALLEKSEVDQKVVAAQAKLQKTTKRYDKNKQKIEKQRQNFAKNQSIIEHHINKSLTEGQINLNQTPGQSTFKSVHFQTSGLDSRTSTPLSGVSLDSDSETEDGAVGLDQSNLNLPLPQHMTEGTLARRAGLLTELPVLPPVPEIEPTVNLVGSDTPDQPDEPDKGTGDAD